MTLDELKRDWKKYVIEMWDTGDEIIMKDAYAICWGKHEDGLLFDTGGEQGSPAHVFKCDEEGFCYNKHPRTGEWRLVGKFIKTED